MDELGRRRKVVVELHQLEMNPLVRFVTSVLAVGILITIIVVDDVQLSKTAKMLASTESNLVQTTSSLNQCSDAREGDQALTQRAISAAQDCQRLLHEQMQSKGQPELDETVKWMTNMPEPLVLYTTNRSDLVHLSRNGQTILTVDPNFNVLVHGQKVGRITETNWSPEP